YASHRPSWIIESITCAWPRRSPSRALGRRYGAFVIDSMPPATTMSCSPVMMALLPMTTALRPDPHTLLTVTAPTELDTPAPIDAWRAGACPCPAGRTHPM